jgi:hypothetical protein
VVSHHLNVLRRVTASSVLQLVPVGVRCVAGSTDPHHPGKPESGGSGRTIPAARAPFEEPYSSTGDNTSRCRRYPREVASHPVQTRRRFPDARHSAGLYSVDECGPSHSPLPVRAMALVLPWASIPTTPLRPKPLEPAGCDVKERFRDVSSEENQRPKRLLGQHRVGGNLTRVTAAPRGVFACR